MTPANLDSVSAIEAEYAERISAAQRATEERRDAALVPGVPFEVCGVRLRVMTFDDFLTLIVCGNAHVTRVAEPEAERARRAFWALHNAQLIWFLSPEFSPDPARRDAFFADFGRFNNEQVERAVFEYIRELFADAPRGRTLPPGESPPPDPVGVSFAIHWTAALSKRFRWSRAELRALPLPELFQYLRLIAAEKKAKTGKFVYTLDSEVDRLWAEMLQRIAALNPPSA
jgi:hypothetical protein